MIDLDEFNQDIDFNFTASEVLREMAPHLLYELQNEFLQLALAEGTIKIDPHTGNEYWVED
jgi:hypothetical protein|tara:strand:+ start:906 stop:1088 length:183 start_codon:yes stop_codon:yes gene_type:complete